MKIAYFVYFDLSHESGVVKKIRAQLDEWSKLGHDIRLFALTPKSTLWSGLDESTIEFVHSPRRISRNADVRSLREKIIKWQPDLLYWRFGSYVPAFERLFTETPTIFEMNTYDLGEKKQTLPYYKYLYHRFTRNRLLRTASGLVCVTNELANMYKQLEKPTAVVSNAINLNHFQILEPTDNKFPRIVFLGNDLSQPWHDIEKIVWLAKQLPDCQIDIIGSNFPENLIANGQPTNLTLHGFLSVPAYIKLLCQTDIGIGMLGLYHNSMDEACSLKVREYLAYGIPVILGNLDTDFPEPTSFILGLPNTPDNVSSNLKEIQAFIERWQNKRIDRSEVEHIDVEYKEKVRLDFFQTIVNKGH